MAISRLSQPIRHTTTTTTNKNHYRIGRTPNRVKRMSIIRLWHLLFIKWIIFAIPCTHFRRLSANLVCKCEQCDYAAKIHIFNRPAHSCTHPCIRREWKSTLFSRLFFCSVLFVREFSVRLSWVFAECCTFAVIGVTGAVVAPGFLSIAVVVVRVHDLAVFFFACVLYFGFAVGVSAYFVMTQLLRAHEQRPKEKAPHKIFQMTHVRIKLKKKSYMQP